MTEPTAADLSRLIVIIPVAGLEEAKTRLGATLDAEERQALVLGLLDRTVRAADAVEAVAAVVAVSPDPIVLKAASTAGATPVRQPDHGLNEGLRSATRWAAADGATAILVLAGDLPGVTTAAIRMVIQAASATREVGRPLVAIVADRHGRGTNALLVSPPGAIEFAFGPGSRTAHREAAEAAGAVVIEPDGPLALDLDLPEDFTLAEELGLLDPARVG